MLSTGIYTARANTVRYELLYCRLTQTSISNDGRPRDNQKLKSVILVYNDAQNTSVSPPFIFVLESSNVEQQEKLVSTVATAHTLSLSTGTTKTTTGRKRENAQLGTVRVTVTVRSRETNQDCRSKEQLDFLQLNSYYQERLKRLAMYGESK
jgi:hypothetical protein